MTDVERRVAAMKGWGAEVARKSSEVLSINTACFGRHSGRTSLSIGNNREGFTMKASTIRKTTWDSTLQWVGGLAWLLSVAALVASAAEINAGEIKTAVVPASERGTAQTESHSFNRNQPVPQFNGRDRYQPINTNARPYETRRPNYNSQPTRFDQNASDCPDGNCDVRRRNYRHIFGNGGLRNDRFDNGYQTVPASSNGNPFDQPYQSIPVSLPEPNSSPFDRPTFETPRFNNPVDPYATPAPGSSNVPTAQEKVEYRYADPLAVQLGRTSTVGKATSLYLEASNLIDTRHVSPVGYEARTAAALEGLATAINTPAFQRAAGANASASQVSMVQSQLRTLATRPARSSAEGASQMQQAASLVNRSLGMPEGMVAMEFVHATIDALDRFSAIVPRQSAMADELAIETASTGTDLELRTAGLEENIVGVGVEMKTDARGAIVLGTIEGGPAAEAGVKTGDIITGVNGRNVAGMSLAEIANLIGGSAGTQVSFTIDRNGRNGNLAMTRRSMYVSSVASVEMIDESNGVAYARLKQFSANSAKDLQNAMWKLHNQGMKSFVLDLRGNPGGLLTSAIEISNLFLPCGSIVSTRGRNADDNTEETASYAQTWKTPLVVLIDDGSASASEILAAAIQDNERGVIVGRRSYGKGTVQTHFPLRTVAGNLKLTTAKFYSPKGREMAGAGVVPDVRVNGETDRSAGVANDRDVRAAISLLGQGRPQELASSAAKCFRNANQLNGLAR